MGFRAGCSCSPTPGGRTPAKVARAFVEALTGHGIMVRLLADEAADLGVEPGDYDPPLELTESETDASHECELTLVVGGDGSILRAAEVTHARLTPVLGVNLGHVGFLAEAEHDDVESTIDAIVHRRYTAEDRLTIDVERLPRRRAGGEHVRGQRGQRREGGSGADARGRRRDRRPPAVAVGMRRRGVCDPDRLHRLQLLRRRTDRVAAGRGAVHRPDQRARAVRPADGGRAHLGARHRGARPHRGRRRAVGDGRRTVDLPPGARIEVRRGEHPVRLVAAARGAVHRPAGGQVRAARRGLARAPPSAAPGRADDRGDPDRLARGDRLLDPRARTRPHRDHRRDRRRQDHGRHRARAAAGRPRRQRRGAQRCPAGPDRGRGGRRRRRPEFWDSLRRRRGQRRRRGRGRPGRAGPQPVGRGPVARVRRRRRGAGDHARPGRRAAGRRARPVRPAPAAASPRPARRAGPVRRRRRCWTSLAALSRALRPAAAPSSASSTRWWPPPASAPGRPTCSGSGSARSRRSPREAGEDARLAAEESRLGFADTLRAAAEQAREALSSEQEAPGRARGASPRPAGCSTASASTTPAAGELADRLAEVTYLLSDLAADVASYAARHRHRPGPAGRGLGAAGGADRAHPQVRREHRRGARLGGAVRRAGCWTSTRPTSASSGLRAEQERLRAELAEAAAALSAARTEAAGRLSSEVTDELALLAMPDARRRDRA